MFCVYTIYILRYKITCEKHRYQDELIFFPDRFMPTKKKTRDKMQSKNILNVFHRVFEVIARAIFLLIAYVRGPAAVQPPIKDLTLLHSASTLALKIRTKQVSLFAWSS